MALAVRSGDYLMREMKRGNVQYVRSSFFAARPFTTLEDFNRQALA